MLIAGHISCGFVALGRLGRLDDVESTLRIITFLAGNPYKPMGSHKGLIAGRLFLGGGGYVAWDDSPGAGFANLFDPIKAAQVDCSRGGGCVWF